MFYYHSGIKMLRNANFKNKRFSFACMVYLFGCIGDFMKNVYFQWENTCSQFPPTELVRNLIQIWDWSDEQNTIILQRLKGKRVRKTQIIIVVTTKQWILAGGFSLRIEISGKGCVCHNLPWVFNSYVLLRRGELNIMVEEERRKKDPSPRSQDKLPGSASLWPEGNNKGPIEGWQISGSTPFGAEIHA